MFLSILRIQNETESNLMINEEILSWERKKSFSLLSNRLHKLKLHPSLEMDPGDMDEQQMKVRPMWKRFNKVTIMPLSFDLINIHSNL